MLEVTALLLESHSRARVREALRRHAHLVFCDTRTQLRASMMETKGDVAIFQLRDKEGASTLPVVAEIREGHPGAAIVLYCSLEASDVREIPEATRAGANVVMLRGHDDVGERMRARIESALQDSVSLRVMRDLAPRSPPSVHSILECCLRGAHEQLTVERVAKKLGRHRNTLACRLAAADMPSLQEVIGWCELLVAASLLHRVPLSANGVARALSFPSGAAFRATLRRYTGLTPRKLLKDGGYQLLLQMFCAQLAAPEVVLPAKKQDRDAQFPLPTVPLADQAGRQLRPQ